MKPEIGISPDLVMWHLCSPLDDMGSLYIFKNKIIRFLSILYNNHRYFKVDLYLNYLIKRAYWPTQVKDIYAWCRSCDSYQARIKKQIRVIIRLYMIIGDMYMFILVNYFKIFVKTKVYLKNTINEIIYIYNNLVFSILEYSKVV